MATQLRIRYADIAARATLDWDDEVTTEDVIEWLNGHDETSGAIWEIVDRVVCQHTDRDYSTAGDGGEYFLFDLD